VERNFGAVVISRLYRQQEWISKMRSATSADGTVIGYQCVGQGPPLLLVHGTAETRRRWAPLHQSLGSHYSLCEMDRRGRGLSSGETGPYDLAREAEDVAAVAESLGGDVYVLGHSFGALAVMEAAVVTTAIRRIVLHEPPLPKLDAELIPMETITELKQKADPKLILRTFYRVTGHAPDAGEENDFSPEALATAPTVLRELAAIKAYRVNERLGRITAPVRMLLGTASPAHLRMATDTIAGQIRDATIVTLPGLDHRAVDEAPEQFGQAILAFDVGVDAS
jgi:pimeloyl-ACP methyl ester carboxylesterase